MSHTVRIIPFGMPGAWVEIKETKKYIYCKDPITGTTKYPISQKAEIMRSTGEHMQAMQAIREFRRIIIK